MRPASRLHVVRPDDVPPWLRRHGEAVDDAANRLALVPWLLVFTFIAGGVAGFLLRGVL